MLEKKILEKKMLEKKMLENYAIELILDEEKLLLNTSEEDENQAFLNSQMRAYERHREKFEKYERERYRELMEQNRILMNELDEDILGNE